MSQTPVQPNASPRRAFTLVEILIVVVILGILAAIAVPKFANASHSAHESSLKDDLRYMRTQIAVYASQHYDIAPGYPAGNVGTAATATAFVAQLTGYTDQSGNTSATSSTAYPMGPYLPNIPPNPVNNLTTVEIIGAGAALTPDNTTGWLYQPSTSTIIPNLTGSDSEGLAYTAY